MNFFKSVKKAFSKVGKIVKKIAPVLVVAAAVYFGGAYLMASAGTVGSAAGASVTYGAGGVAEAFTKSAGVWKSFLGGLSSGTASQSAVAFAEGSFKASQLGMSLSGQVAAGTSAVNFLSSGVSTSQAISQGVSLADQAFKNGSNVQSSWDILWNGLDKTVGSSVAPSAPASKAMGLMGENPADFSVNNEGLFGPQGTAMADATQLEGGQAATGSSVAGTDFGAMSDASVADQNGGMITGESSLLSDTNKNLGGIFSNNVSANPSPVVTQPQVPTTQSYMLEYIKANADAQIKVAELHAKTTMEEIAARTKADNWKLGLTASGLFLNAFGQYQQARSAEKQERNRFMTTPALEEAFKNAYSS